MASYRARWAQPPQHLVYLVAGNGAYAWCLERTSAVFGASLKKETGETNANRASFHDKRLFTL
jgi:hypothetical protein